MRWGLGPKLRKYGGVTRGITFHDGNYFILVAQKPFVPYSHCVFYPATLGVTGEEIGELLYHAEIMKELAADAVLMRVSFSSAFGVRGDRQLSLIPVLVIALHLSRRLLSCRFSTPIFTKPCTKLPLTQESVSSSTAMLSPLIPKHRL